MRLTFRCLINPHTYRVTILLPDSSWWAATMAAHSPGRMAEHLNLSQREVFTEENGYPIHCKYKQPQHRIQICPN